MRQIKFRAWDGNRMRGIEKNDYFSIRNDGLPSQNVEVSLMQYTGLTDVNGVEIYEGDWIAGRQLKVPVTFEEGSFMAGPKALLRDVIKAGWVVESNIHENPELLETTNEN